MFIGNNFNSKLYFTFQSLNVGSQAFDQEWWNKPIPYQKNILIVLTRTQKPAKLAALGFGPVSLMLFSEVMKTSYQFYVILRNIYEK